MEDNEFSNQNATKEQVRQAIRTAEELMEQPLPLTQEYPVIALVGYQKEDTGEYMLLKEIRIFSSFQLFNAETGREGFIRLLALSRRVIAEYVRESRQETAQDKTPFLYRTVEEISGEEVERRLNEFKKEDQ